MRTKYGAIIVAHAVYRASETHCEHALLVPHLLSPVSCMLTMYASFSIENENLPEDTKFWGTYFQDDETKKMLKTFDKKFAQYGSDILGKYD